MIKNQILQGDVIDIIKTLLAESINCIVTSPPYYGLRDYGLPPTYWPAVIYSPMAGLPSITIPAMSCCLGLEDSIEAYVGHMVLVFRELRRVLRDDGTVFLNLGDSYANSSKGSIVTKNSTLSGSKTYQANGTPPKLLDKSKLENIKQKDLIGIPWRTAFALQADGWYLRSDIIWHKLNPMPESVTDRPTKSHEYVFLLTKKAKYWYDQEAIREGNSEQAEKFLINWKSGGKHGRYKSNRLYNGEKRMSGRHIGQTINPAGRNSRSVWSLASTPYKGAHFAVFPEELARRCLLAGCPSRVCVECGEPWVRVVEMPKAPSEVYTETSKPKDGFVSVNVSGKGMGQKYQKWRNDNPPKTLHFTPTCQCCPLPAIHTDEFGHQWPIYNFTRPGIALDPFFGSGTVGVVAKQHKRYWLGIELNSDYVEMAQERLDQTQPALFAT